jgi:hypothetical protein
MVISFVLNLKFEFLHHKMSLLYRSISFNVLVLFDSIRILEATPKTLILFVDIILVYYRLYL